MTESSGDVFADLGIELNETDRLKTNIAAVICALLARMEITQAEAARILGTDQAKVSKITRGHLKDFSADRMIEWLVALGADVDIRISRPHQGRGHITVRQPVAA